MKLHHPPRKNRNFNIFPLKNTLAQAYRKTTILQKIGKGMYHLAKEKNIFNMCLFKIPLAHANEYNTNITIEELHLTFTFSQALKLVCNMELCKPTPR